VCRSLSPAEPIVPESFSFPGLRAFLDRLLDDIVLTSVSARLNFPAVLRVIQQTAQRLDLSLTRRGCRPQQLKPVSRALFHWFSYFADQKALRTYVEALSNCRDALNTAQRKKPRWSDPMLIHFRPSSHLYSWKRQDNGTRIILPTPMISFDDELFRHLAQYMCRRSPSTVLSSAMLSPPYRAIAEQIDLGPTEHTQGRVYDLAESFDRVNREYFNNQSPRPTLHWSRRLTRRKFGHYDLLRDTVMISRTLDRTEVPPFVLDHVMHHELLHKKHGFIATSRRRCFHTSAFRADEKTFLQFKEADRFLNQLAVQRWKERGIER
jgi:hypothetical protein